MSGRSKKIHLPTAALRGRARLESLETRQLLSVSFTGTQIAADPQSHAAVLADVNGDGVPDLVVAQDTYAGQVEIRFGNGNGTFRPEIGLAVGANPTDVIVADLTGDGLNDIVTTNGLSGTVSVLLQTQFGTFEPAVSFPTGLDPNFVAAADLNNNGREDLIVTNSGDGSTVFLLGNGDGTFGLPTPVNVVNGTTFGVAAPLTVNGRVVAVGDVNGDGRPDLVVSYLTANPNNYSVTVLRGTGNGTFVRPFVTRQNPPGNYYAAQVYSAVGQNPTAFTLGDVNGDGRPDLVVSNYGTYSSVHVLLNRGGAGFGGRFGATASFAVGFDPDSVALADFNGDGQLDVVTANRNEQDLSVLQGNGDGNFQAAQEIPLGSTNFPIFVGAADINGDGKPDIVALNALAPSYTISILQNTTFEAPFAQANDHTLTIFGTPGNDTIYEFALSGLFNITENGVTSQVFPAPGIRTINIVGENGNDSVTVGFGVPGGTIAGGLSTVDGGTGSDTVLAGTASMETILGGAVLDSVIMGGPGSVQGGNGVNVFVGGIGSETLAGGVLSTNYMTGGLFGAQLLVGGSGADTLVAGGGADTVEGNGGGDSIIGGTGPDSLSGGAGRDTITAGTGNNTLDGGAGADSLVGGQGMDSLNGGPGPDTIVAVGAFVTPVGVETINGGLGNDSMVVFGPDWLIGGGGTDTIVELA